MSLNIQITQDYRITSDSHNVIVNRRHIVDPTKSPNWAQLEAQGKSSALRETWKEISYHPSLEQALKSLVRKKLLESGAKDIAELLSEIKRFEHEIKAVING